MRIRENFLHLKTEEPPGYSVIPPKVPELLRELTAIQEVLLAYSSNSGVKPQLTLTERTPRQQRLRDHLAIPMPIAKQVI